MKKLIMIAALALMAPAASAQRNAQDYFVKTKNAKEATKVSAKESTADVEEKSRSLMNQLFPRMSLCEWNDSMVFMVLPDKRDLVIRVFHDGFTNNAVSTVSLRYKILRYQNHIHDNGSNRDRICFVTDDAERHPYYFEVPSGTFEDYCYTKFGVPALAYLNDVETARTALMGKTLVTKSTTYRIDATYGEGSEEVTIPLESEVKVVKIGVGTRSFPVKIVVADKDGREFFQNVAISRTNSGLRDEEFNMMDNQHHTFETAFDMMGDFALPSWHYNKYLDKTVFTRKAMKMSTPRGDEYSFPGLTVFRITDIKSQRGKASVKLTLTHPKTNSNYVAEVFFRDAQGATGGQVSSNLLFENLFGMGNPGSMKGVDSRHLEAIRKGVVQRGFTETEVRLVRDDDYELVNTNGSTYSWRFSALSGHSSLLVVFDKRTKRVVKVIESQ